jgi:hypothetical protein
MKRWTDVILTEMEQLPQKIRTPFEAETPPSGELQINLAIGSPPVEPFLAELERLEKQPWIWRNE